MKYTFPGMRGKIMLLVDCAKVVFSMNVAIHRDLVHAAQGNVSHQTGGSL